MDRRNSNLDDSSQLESVVKENPYKQKTWSQTYLSTWEFGAMSSCGVATTILIFNLSVVLWASTRHEVADGVRSLYEGDCTNAKSINTRLQLLVNTLCSVLLALSNYCIQCVNSPTRSEVDKAHAQRVSLSIGVASLSNLKWISYQRLILWFSLGLSALPINFLSNSVVFMTTQANSYTVLAGPPNFLDSKYNYTDFYRFGDRSEELIDTASKLREQIQNVGRFEKLTVQQCAEAYSQQFVSDHGDLLLIQKSTVLYGTHDGSQIVGSRPISADGSIIRPTSDATTMSGYTASSFIPLNSNTDSYGRPLPNGVATNQTVQGNVINDLPFKSHPLENPSYRWQCPWGTAQHCSDEVTAITSRNMPWAPYGSEVLYCQSQVVDAHCKLGFRSSIAYVVICCNVIKVIVMLVIWRRGRRGALMNLGDAIQSFLDEPDKHTSGLCTMSASDMSQHWEYKKPSINFAYLRRGWKRPMQHPPYPRKMNFARRYWGHSATSVRWMMCFSMLASAVIVGWYLTIASSDGQNFQRMEAPMGRYIFFTRTSVLGTVFIANLPQVLLSSMYLAFNASLTCMLAGREWMQYCRKRKTLRVTSPVGVQRSTYYLQLPYRYSIPLIVYSIFLSWLTSQSLYMISVVIHDTSDPAVPDKTVSMCGYSPGAIWIITMMLLSLALVCVILGLRRYPGGMPLASTSSAAISAACHPRADDPDASVLPIQWGVTSDGGKVGHCSFSSQPVGWPVPNKLYA